MQCLHSFDRKYVADISHDQIDCFILHLLTMEQLFPEAIATWKLSELYHDLAVIKGHALTDWEKTCLRGLLCRYSPKHIAQQTYWTVNSLRTELSRRLYRYIEGLTHSQKSSIKVSWNTIADSLDDLGYKQVCNRSITSNAQEPMLSFSQPVIDLAKFQSLSESVIQVSEIIVSISKLSLVSSCDVSIGTVGDDKIINLASKQTKEGNIHLQQQKYGQALQCYHSALVSSTSLDISIIINIAICYDQLHLHGDALALCYFILSFLPSSKDDSSVHLALRDENRYKIHTFIGGVFRALAIEKSDPAYFNIALEHYDLAIYYNSRDVSPLRQQLDLILAAISDHNFSEIDRQRYLDLARTKINKLLDFSSTANLERVKLIEQALPRYQSAVKQ
jgi:tetratricopeptide (TPR) repeat protein